MEQQEQNPPGSGGGWSYAQFVTANPTAARTLESLLQYSGFFAPARFADRDLSIESGYALSSLAALAHDRILLHSRAQAREEGAAGDGQGSGSSIGLDPKRRERLSSSKAVFAERMRVALAMIAHVQVVVEKLAGQHGGPRRRRQAITYLETLKALSRLLLLACSREMVTGGGVVYTGKRSGVRLVVPPRASVIWSGRGRSNRPIGVGRAAIAASSSSSSSLCADGSGGVQQSPAEVYCSTCRERPNHGGSGSSRVSFDGYGVRQETGAGRLGEAAHNTSGVSCFAEECRHRRQAQEELDLAPPGGRADGGSHAWLMAGEIIHILRPLVYSYSCGSAGERSWRPWLTSLGMDAAAFACTARAGGGGPMSLLIPIGAGGGVPVLPFLSEEQAAELRRRKLLWFLYLMRSPAFELLAEPVSRGAAGVFEGVPLLGGMAAYALNMLLYVQRHHFYTSAS